MLAATPALDSVAGNLAAVSSGTWVAATTATDTPRTVKTAGAKASAAVRPTPITGIGLAALAASVSASPTGPKSTAWLLAIPATSTPAVASVVSAEAGARKVNDLGSGVPRVVIEVSRLTTVMSAAPSSGRSSASPSPPSSKGRRCRSK